LASNSSSASFEADRLRLLEVPEWPLAAARASDEPFQALNPHFHANVHVFTQVLYVYAGFGRLRIDYAVITQ
jgi:hypothetical protein